MEKKKEATKRSILPPKMCCVKKKTIKRVVSPPIMDLSDREKNDHDVGRDGV